MRSSLPIRQTLILVAGGLVLVGALAMALPGPAPWVRKPADPQVDPQSLSWYAELVDGNVCFARKVYATPTRSCTLSYSSKGMSVKIKRNERESPSSAWASQSQELTTSYYIVDLQSWRDRELFVAGIYPDGRATVERWVLTHPPSQSAQGNYVPLDQRRLPTVRRAVLESAASLGLVRSIEVDPENRFLLALTQSPRVLYKIPLGAGAPSAAQPILTESTFPQLAQVKTLVFAEHATEGRKVVLQCKKRWVDTQEGGFDPAEFVVLLNDPDGDGAFAAPVVIDHATWAASDYKQTSSWTLWGSVGSPP